MMYLLILLTILLCLALLERKKSVGKLFWHIHHDQLLEMATEPIARRKTHIRRYKPVGERKTRLRCLRPVKGTLPGEIIEAFRVQAGVEARYYEVLDMYPDIEGFDSEVGLRMKTGGYVDCLVAKQNLQDTLQKYESEINRLHDEECDCFWNGTTLFPGG